ncbi:MULTISPECIES: sensor histidine kinase [Enterococcus]|uniref:histidine kinase n=1 Tax=Candidatus Enterococcus murrayae TaxID=2815321 RepID=A0ABS3HD24_9ENTE|nr:ATP-binding protein [Enterococcus sp. MJM16]MBO0451356.1 GHKL domain-containing protein [Enterococcus sp. MJM16]
MRRKLSIFSFILLSVALIIGLYFLFIRTNLHHTILDGFYNVLIQSTADEEGYRQQYIDWPTVKLFLILFALTIIFIVSLASYLIYRNQMAKNTHLLAGKIAQFFSDPSAASTGEVVIDNELLKIKSDIENNELLLKRETQRTKDLITYLAHDLRTPLVSVIGYLNLMIDSEDLTEEQKKHFLAITLEKSTRLEHLIDDFFDITRFNLHDIQLYKEKLDFVFLLNQMVDEFYPLLKEKNQSLTYDGPESFTLLADNEQLARVLNNLLKNAMNYGTTNSTIHLRLSSDAENMIFSISNEGITIPENQLANIFEKFYRLDKSRSTKTGGAGLGLAIAKEIILAHQGTITAASDNGLTKFTITLPLESA